ncbi:hypothetical protein AB0E69_26130 [Kribbella sp. NPDC026611]|uniref:hypothetical protein n=1 Tax=Kribbella sp. NPDC026611 TaxID=3154911 RepID=UPI00340767FF
MVNPTVLTTDSTLNCFHGFAVSAGSSSRLRVGGKNVLLAKLGGKSIDCKVPNDPTTSTKQCTKVTQVSAGESSKLTVGGASVLLTGLAGISDGGPPLAAAPLLPAVANQSKLRAAVAP